MKKKSRKGGKKAKKARTKSRPAKKPRESPKEIQAGKKILIIGVDESERDSIVEMVLKGNRKSLPKLAFAKLPDFSGASGSGFEKKRRRFYSEFERLLQRKGNLVLSGSLTIRTGQNFSPLFTGEFFNRFCPDLTILMEIDTREAFVIPGYGVVKRKVNMGEVRFQQEMNRYYASLLFGPLRILPVKRENIKKVLRDLRELLMEGLKE